MLSELEKLEANLGGVADLKRQPDALFVLDLRKEQIAVKEARRLGLPIIGLVDTNCDPDEADYVIPGNDDAIRSCSLIVRAISEAIEAGKTGVAVEEFERNGKKEAETSESEEEAPPAPDETPVEHEPMAKGESAVETEAAEATPEPEAAEATLDPEAAEATLEPEAAEATPEPVEATNEEGEGQ